MTRLLPLLLLLASLCGCQRAFFAAVNGGATPAARGLPYGEDPMQRLDVYRPDRRDAAPVVLFLYGGRWQGGSRAQYAFVGEALAARGVLTLVADYRRYPQVRFPLIVADAARAVRWTRDHAAEHGGDPSRLFVVGHSAGAHLAAMLATDARHLAVVGMAPRDLRGVVGVAGPYDFLPLTERDLQDIFGPEPQWPASQPINFVDGDEPPLLLLHGADDKLVWPRNSARLAARVRAAGGHVEHRVYPDLGHVRILGALRFPALAPTLQHTLAFIDARSSTSPVDVGTGRRRAARR